MSEPELDPETQRFFQAVLFILGAAVVFMFCLMARLVYQVAA